MKASTAVASRGRNAALAALVLLGCLPLGASAGEPDKSEQPLLMPIKELYKALEKRNKDEFVLVPLAQYRELTAAARERDPEVNLVPSSKDKAWLENARITGVLRQDHLLDLEADLDAVSTAPGAARCRLFATAPEQLSAVTIAGHDALYAAGDDGLDLLLPSAGRYPLHLVWHVRLVADDKDQRGTLPLPLAAGIELRLTSATAGTFMADGLARSGDGDAAQPATIAWRLATASGPLLPLRWQPGLGAERDDAVFGIEQAVLVALVPGARRFRWTARLQPRRGALPTELDLTVPAGWTATTAGAGILALSGSGDRLHLRIDGKASEISVDGQLADDAVIDLPRLAGAAYQGGVVAIGGALDQWPAYAVPALWRPIPPVGDQDGTTGFLRTFAVAEPGHPLTVTGAPANDAPTLATTAVVAIGPQRWRVQEYLVLRLGAQSRFALPLRLPAGWKLSSLSVLRGGEWAPQQLPDPPAEGAYTLPLASVAKPGATVGLELVLERDAAAGFSGVPIASVDGAARANHRLVVEAAPGLDVDLAPAAGWRLTGGKPAIRAGALRVELLATGAAPTLDLAVRPRRLDGEVEAVSYVVPVAGEVRCRIDLRIRAREQDITALTIGVPFTAGEAVRLEGQGETTWQGDKLVLRFPAPWRGERLVRLEGRVDAKRQQLLPRLQFNLPLHELVVVQAPEDLEVAVKSGPGAIFIDEDSLPAWSSPFPGPPVLQALRLGQGEAGGFTVVERPLAGAPAGFVDRLQLSTQLDPAGSRTLVRCRIVAPGLQALPLGLPSDHRLLQATIDGLAVSVRLEDGELVLPLPGRTQVQVALLIAGPAPAADFRLPPPRLGGLPATHTRWRVAVSPDFSVVPAEGAGVLPLIRRSFPAVRRAWRSWTTPVAAVIDDGAPPALLDQTSADPRMLVPAAQSELPRGEPTLVLSGQILDGEHGGTHLDLRLHLAELDGLRAADRWGRLLGVLAALGLVALAGARLHAAVAVAGVLAVIALTGWQATAGPLLGFAETLPPALLAVLILIWPWQRLRSGGKS